MYLLIGLSELRNQHEVMATHCAIVASQALSNGCIVYKLPDAYKVTDIKVTTEDKYAE